jgi:tetratricopeptide (TPR) repeat protein
MRLFVRRTARLGLCLGLLTACGSSYESTWDEEDPQPTSGGTASGGGDGLSAAELVARGDEAWAQRDDEAQVRAALEAWGQAVQANPEDAATWVKLSRGHYFLAHGHLRWSDPEAVAETYQEGIRAAERALRAQNPAFAERMAAGERMEDAVPMLEAESVPAMYWWASNLGRWARLDGFATILSRKDEIRATMTRAMELDRYFYFAGPDRYFGAFFAVAPAYAGGDLERSQQHFEESLRRHPNYFGTHVLYAENLSVKQQDRESFVEHLNAVIEGDPEALPEAGPENRVEQRLARELLEQVDDLFVE